MVLKTLFNELRRKYNSFYKPARIDLAVVRRERLSIIYAFFSFLLVVCSTVAIYKDLGNPALMEQRTIKPPPNSHHYKLEFRPFKFTRVTENEKNEDVDEENNSSEQMAIQGENLTNEVQKNVSV